MDRLELDRRRTEDVLDAPVTIRVSGPPPSVIDLRTPAEIERSSTRTVRRRGLWAIATLALLQFGDVLTTDALEGDAEELNPVAQWLLDRTALLPAKLAVVAVLAAVFLAGHRRVRPRFVTLLWVAVGIYGVVVLSNTVQVILADAV